MLPDRNALEWLHGGDTVDLREFRQRLEPLMLDSTWRPFVCPGGSPIECHIFVVGINAGHVTGDFWSYWDDSIGFLYDKWLLEYESLNKIRGTRRALGWLLAGMGHSLAQRCLETNIFATPTRRERDLVYPNRKTEIFDFLFNNINPCVLLVHGNEPRCHVQALLEGYECSEEHAEFPVERAWTARCRDRRVVVLETKHLRFASRRSVELLAQAVRRHDESVG